jgi:hypothetical protein
MLTTKISYDIITIVVYAAIAQQAEHILGKDEVIGSNPISSSIKIMITERKTGSVIFYFL